MYSKDIALQDRGNDVVTDRPKSLHSEDEYASWDHPKQWPHDPPGHVFLARACQELGRAMFGARWAESWGEPDEPPDDCDRATWKDYERACDEFQRDLVTMRGDVVRTIANQCEAGTLVAAVRPKSGGRMIRLEQYIWNFEDVEYRFHRCDMSLDNPFEVGGDSYRPYWIFLEGRMLDAFLSLSQHGLPAPNPRPSTSAGSVPRTSAFDQPRDHRKIAAQKALLDIYGPNGPDLGETEEICHQKVNEWLRNKGKPGVSKATLRRAKHALRDG
jgi:hypothetical protein